MALQFAYSSLKWRLEDLEKNLALLAEHGWEGWETRESLDWLGTPARIRKVCADAGVAIAAVSGPNVTGSKEDPAHAINRRRIEFASECGVELFMTKGPRHGDVSPTSDEELDRVADIYNDLAEYGKPLGVTVTWHPHVNHFVDSSDEWKRFAPRLDACRLCLDMSHAVLWGYDPEQAARDYADRIAYVHLHDKANRNNEGGDLGDGPMCDYKAFLNTVEEVGYSGWVVVCPGGTRPDAESMDINRNYLKSLGY